MYLLQTDTNENLGLWIFLIAVIGLVVNYFLIKMAVKDAIKEQLDSLLAYKIIELKRAGVSYKELQDARKYLDLVNGVNKSVIDQKQLSKEIEKFWSADVANQTEMKEKVEMV